ncbi:MAG: hypothetical protein DDT40_01017 [candidate division WS2 bacterium]|nr:hypothetical protein [Candidatus Psychracetigena formicireducens]
MPELLQGTFLTGAVVIVDSREIPQLITDIAQGLNGSIAFTFRSYERKLTVEFRSLATLTTLFSGIDTSGGNLIYDGRTYLVKTLSLIEHFNAPSPMWTYDITLYRG